MEVEVFNPHEKPLEELPTIFGFNNGGSPGFLHAQLIAEDGTPLGSHICSGEGFMPGDLGIKKGSRSDRHECFKEHYPDGYKMEFVGGHEVRTHDGLKKAIENNKNLKPEQPESASDPSVEVTVAKETDTNPECQCYEGDGNCLCDPEFCDCDCHKNS